jgi:hypothetical protein
VLSEEEHSRYSLFREAIVAKCGIKDDAARAGLGRDIHVRINLLEKSAGSQTKMAKAFTINTGHQKR